jgi:two-component system, NarL family, response regulator NreC
MKKIRVLLADDHAIVRRGLRLLLASQADMEVVGECIDGKEACEKALELSPDVILMDIAMPVLNGIAATEEIRASCPTVSVLVLTAQEDPETMYRLLRIGALGYVLKCSSADILPQAVREVARGQVFLDPALGARIAGGMIAQEDNAGKPEHRKLSARETEVLRLIAWGYSNKEIAARLSLSVKTVETHKTRMMHKMSMRNRTDMVRFAVQQGWLKET